MDKGEFSCLDYMSKKERERDPQSQVGKHIVKTGINKRKLSVNVPEQSNNGP